MKVLGIIPSRYQSVRFPGKPLADIGGKPMIWWVYQQASKAAELDELIVATDDERIEAACREYGIPTLMTDSAIPSPTDRVCAVSRELDADLYLCINGDEPMVSPGTIDAVVRQARQAPGYYVVHAVAPISTIAEAVDYSNLKTVAGPAGDAIYISRSPVPYPKGSLDVVYHKLVCAYSFSKEAIEFFRDTPKGPIETVEECDILRFLEHRKPVKFVAVGEASLSVDTIKDLEKVRELLQGNQ